MTRQARGTTIARNIDFFDMLISIFSDSFRGGPSPLPTISDPLRPLAKWGVWFCIDFE